MVFKTHRVHLTLGLKVSEHSFYFCDVVDFYFYLKEMAILDSFIKLNIYVYDMIVLILDSIHLG